MATTETLPDVERLADVRGLRSLLDAAAFTTETLQRLLHAGGELITRPAELPLQLRRLRGDESAAAALTKLFVLGVTMERDRADASLAPFGVAGLERLRLVREHEGGVRGSVRLVPYDDLIVVSDRPDESTRADVVAGVHRPSTVLAHLTVRRTVSRALDVGTGNGVQAILAARHAEHVVATDVNARALVFARLNALLNGAENIQFREGSFLEPVNGERFDLIVANPPYVISPESEFLFRDSGLGGDRVSEEVVRALPAALEEGGYATVMVSWIQSGEDVVERPTAWVEDSGCDAWILHTRTDDALSTAGAWNRDAKTVEEYAERMDRWTDYYAREGIDAVSYGGIVLRRRHGANWVRTAELPTDRLGPAGEHLERMFAAQDLLARADEPELLAGRYRVLDTAAVEQELRVAADGWRTEAVTLALREGIGFRAALDDATARVVIALADDVPLGDSLDTLADDVGAEREMFRQAGTELVRRLLTLGFVEPR